MFGIFKMIFLGIITLVIILWITIFNIGTGEYEDNIYVEGVSYYLTIKLDNFKGNIDIISE